MKLQPWMIEYIESKTKWDEDVKQDLYVRLLEMEDKDINKTYIGLMYSTAHANNHNVETRRRELIMDNKDAIRSALGHEGEALDPYDILSIQEELEDRLTNMSPLLFSTFERVVIGEETPEELAEDEGLSPNVIYQRVWQVKQQLKGIAND